MGFSKLNGVVYIISDPQFYSSNGYTHEQFIHFKRDCVPFNFVGNIIRKPLIGDTFQITFAKKFTDPSKQIAAIKNTKDLILSAKDYDNKIILANITNYKEHLLTKVTLNPEQKIIRDSMLNKNIRVCACAGSGKTTTIVQRIKKLIKTHLVPEKNILLVTFSKDAAEEMKSRLAKVLNDITHQCEVQTLDAFALKTLRKYAPKILRNTETRHDVGEYKYILTKILTKNPTLTSELSKLHKYIFIDEFQDIDKHQYAFVFALYRAGSYVTAIGDDAQNIYSFRGTDIRYIKDFCSAFNALDLNLTYNYRSTPEIIALSNAIIDKQMKPTKKSIGVKPEVRYYANSFHFTNSITKQIKAYLARGIKAHEIAVLARNNVRGGGLTRLETAFAKNNIRCILFDHKADVRGSQKQNHISLLTIHKSKGLEWEVVFLIDATDNYFPRTKTAIAIEEDRRLCYVAVTRAKRYLHISFSETKERNARLTRYISQVPRHLLIIDRSCKENHFKLVDRVDPVFSSFTVTDMIQKLEPEHLEMLRLSGILPKFNTIKRKFYDTELKYPKFVHTYSMYAEFGNFIEDYITRGLKHYKNKAANETIARVTLSDHEFAVYERYKTNFKLNLKNIKNFTQDFTKVLETASSDEATILPKISIEDAPVITDICYRVLTNATRYKIKPKSIPLIKENYIPSEFLNEFENNYIKYNDQNLSNSDIRYEIFRISLCHCIVDGRSRLLYKNIPRDLILTECDNLLNSIDKYYIAPLLAKNIPIKTKLYFTQHPIEGELDLMINQSIYDIKVSYRSNFELLHIIQVLCYAALARNVSELPQVKNIGIVNPLKGIEWTIDINEWDRGQELLSFLVKITKLSNKK